MITDSKDMILPIELPFPSNETSNQTKRLGLKFPTSSNNKLAIPYKIIPLHALLAKHFFHSTSIPSNPLPISPSLPTTSMPQTPHLKPNRIHPVPLSAQPTWLRHPVYEFGRVVCSVKKSPFEIVDRWNLQINVQR